MSSGLTLAMPPTNCAAALTMEQREAILNTVSEVDSRAFVRAARNTDSLENFRSGPCLPSTPMILYVDGKLAPFK